MAADILLYQPDFVPVGEDQKQHVEICRDIANRFNGIYGDVFKIPEPYIPQVGARVMSLTSPDSKMSKSDKDPNGCVYMLEKPEDILRKFKKAVTDSDACVRYDKENKPGVSNLMQIYSVATGRTFGEIEAEFAGRGYGDFKKAVGEAVVELLRPCLLYTSWPEVMVTYDTTDKTLFSADAFGTFGALNGVLFADEVDFDRDWLDEASPFRPRNMSGWAAPP